jgi:hypothetical protein
MIASRIPQQKEESNSYTKKTLLLCVELTEVFTKESTAEDLMRFLESKTDDRKLQILTALTWYHMVVEAVRNHNKV